MAEQPSRVVAPVCPLDCDPFLGFCDRIPALVEKVVRARWRVELLHPLGGHPVKK